MDDRASAWRTGVTTRSILVWTSIVLSLLAAIMSWRHDAFYGLFRQTPNDQILIEMNRN